MSSLLLKMSSTSPPHKLDPVYQPQLSTLISIARPLFLVSRVLSGAKLLTPSHCSVCSPATRPSGEHQTLDALRRSVLSSSLWLSLCCSLLHYRLFFFQFLFEQKSVSCFYSQEACGCVSSESRSFLPPSKKPSSLSESLYSTTLCLDGLFGSAFTLQLLTRPSGAALSHLERAR